MSGFVNFLNTFYAKIFVTEWYYEPTGGWAANIFYSVKLHEAKLRQEVMSHEVIRGGRMNSLISTMCGQT